MSRAAKKQESLTLSQNCLSNLELYVDKAIGQLSSGVVGWELFSHTFFTFCFKMSLKLFYNGYFLGALPHLFC